jgi:hypothetical protein
MVGERKQPGASQRKFERIPSNAALRCWEITRSMVSSSELVSSPRSTTLVDKFLILEECKEGAAVGGGPDRTRVGGWEGMGSC